MNMEDTKIVMFVKFESALSEEEVMNVVYDRIDQFRELEGLEQKYYFKDGATGEYGGIYIWSSRAALEEYSRSELRASIAEAYKVKGTPRLEILELFEILK